LLLSFVYLSTCIKLYSLVTSVCEPCFDVKRSYNAVPDAFSDKDDKKSDAEHDEAAIAEARREAEERRQDKHRKMEEEREKMRQDIRDKVYCVMYLNLMPKNF